MTPPSWRVPEPPKIEPGTVVISRAELHHAIDEAMRDAWNEICADTGFHPLDIKRTKGQPISFTPGHWAHAVAQLLSARFGFDPTSRKA